MEERSERRKRSCITALYKPIPALFKQKRIIISRLNRDLFSVRAKQVTIKPYFADLHHFTLQHSGTEDVLFTQKPSSHVATNHLQRRLLLQEDQSHEKGQAAVRPVEYEDECLPEGDRRHLLDSKAFGQTLVSEVLILREFSV